MFCALVVVTTYLLRLQHLASYICYEVTQTYVTVFSVLDVTSLKIFYKFFKLFSSHKYIVCGFFFLLNVKIKFNQKLS